MKVTTEKATDEFGVSKMLVKDLRYELAERDLKRTGNKAELVARLRFHFREMAEENSELAPDDYTSLPTPPEYNPTSASAAVISANDVDTSFSVAALPLIFDSLAPPSLMTIPGHNNLRVTGAAVVSGDAVDTPSSVAVLPFYNLA